MTHIINENIYFPEGTVNDRSAKETAFMAELMAFVLSVVFLLLLTGLLTLAHAKAQDYFPRQNDVTMAQ